jgi:hypothetical protein
MSTTVLTPAVSAVYSETADQLATVIRLTQQVRDALMTAYGEVECHCEQTSAALTYMLLRAGIDAEMVCATAAYRQRDGKDEFGFEPHAWVRVGALLADPTRHQFQAHRDRPLVELWERTEHLYDETNTIDWLEGLIYHRPQTPQQVVFHSETGEDMQGWTTEDRAVFLTAAGLPEAVGVSGGFNGWSQKP